MTPTTVKGVLLAAADRLSGRPWYQMRGNRSTNKSPRAYCLSDAVLFAAREVGARDRVQSLAIAAVERHVGQDATAWNDAPGRTKAQVIAVLKKAASTLALLLFLAPVAHAGVTPVCPGRVVVDYVIVVQWTPATGEGERT